MRLGGTVAGSWKTPEEWEQLLVASKFRAVTAPFTCHTEKAVIDACCEIAADLQHIDPAVIHPIDW